MSEDVVQPLPVVDPALPEDLRELIAREAAASPCPPRTDTGPLTRPARFREGAVHVLAAGFTVAVAGAAAGPAPGLVVAAVILAAYALIMCCGRGTHPAMRFLGLLTGVGAPLAVGVWFLGTALADVPAGLPWLLFGCFTALVGADAATGRVHREPGDYGDLVLTAEDVSDADHPRLAAVQRVIALVERARDEIGDASLDAGRALAVLRDQEWRIASLLARQRELRRAHLRRWQRAASPRVREALKAQREALDTVDGAVRVRVEQITAYGTAVERALEAHREWEQCQEALDSMDEYTDHLASAAFLDTPSAEVGDLSAAAVLARRVRDERVRALAGHPLPPSGPGHRTPEPAAGGDV
ncbi:hypothetical protein [Nocardiopsis sp. LOL_012]|uniref:hypothetical protein n=1 Tax=Nocardiopsis sp. LOL_012 TaxID=3345409 RepID=UPI003A869513